MSLKLSPFISCFNINLSSPWLFSLTGNHQLNTGSTIIQYPLLPRVEKEIINFLWATDTKVYREYIQVKRNCMFLLILCSLFIFYFYTFSHGATLTLNINCDLLCQCAVASLVICPPFIPPTPEQPLAPVCAQYMYLLAEWTKNIQFSHLHSWLLSFYF